MKETSATVNHRRSVLHLGSVLEYYPALKKAAAQAQAAVAGSGMFSHSHVEGEISGAVFRDGMGVTGPWDWNFTDGCIYQLVHN